MEQKTVAVRIRETHPGDAGRGIARISQDVMRSQRIRSGDTVEIIGKSGKASAIVWAGFEEDRGQNVIRIDGNTRQSIQCSIEETVQIRVVTATPAKKIIVNPVKDLRAIHGDEYIKKVLLNRVVNEGQKISADMIVEMMTLSTISVDFIISKTEPKGTVLVNADTVVELKEEAYNPEGARKNIPNVHYEDVGGLGSQLSKIRELIELPLKNPDVFVKLGIEPPKGILLYGPPGTGKTLIAKAVATEVDAHFATISGPEVMSKFVGDSEKRIRDLFKEAETNAPAIIFIDEIDALAQKREDVSGSDHKVVSQILACMDGLKSRSKIVVIAATNIPDTLDPALRRGGRFDRELDINVPDRKGRLEILQIHTRSVPLDKDVDLEYYARVTHGYVGADLALFVKEAAMQAYRKKLLPHLDKDNNVPQEILDKVSVSASEFDEALKTVNPSSMREVLIEAPDVRWENVGGMQRVKRELQEAIEYPLRYPEIFAKLKMKPPKGIMLYGPPGTGKTLVAKAVAGESECNFIAVKGPELLSKWVGESERGVRNIFKKARQAAPSIIFFDEIDALMPQRGSREGGVVTETVVSQILTELDGMEDLKNVVVIGATNRIDMIDDALLRPGRFDRMVKTTEPDQEERREILEVYLRSVKDIVAEDVDLDRLAEVTEGFNGAHIEALVNEAKSDIMRRTIAKHNNNPEKFKKAVDAVVITNEELFIAVERVASMFKVKKNG